MALRPATPMSRHRTTGSARRRLLRGDALAALLLFGAAAGCPRPTLRATPSGPVVVEAGRPGTVAVALIGATQYRADGEAVERVGGWRVALPGTSRLAANDAVVAVAVAGTGPLTGLPGGLRGDPGAAVVGLTPADGQPRWVVGVGATGWASVRALTVAGDDVLVGGAFTGTLRVGDRVLTSAGSVDGFWAILGVDGAVRGVWRMGGAGADAVAGVAPAGDGQLALAGTYSGAAAIDDLDLSPIFTDGDQADGFVAMAGRDGTITWLRTWGGPTVDACAGVARTRDGVVVAGTVRGPVDVAGRRLDAGVGDGLVAFFDERGAVRGAVLVGGGDFDGLTGVVATGDLAVVTGFYAGAIDGPGGRLTATGGDDPLLATVTADGVQQQLVVTADGPAALVGLTAGADGWAAVVDGQAKVAVDGHAAADGSVISRRW